MASAVSGTAQSEDLRISLIDSADETGIVTIPLDGATPDSSVATFVDNYAVLTNALITKVELVRRFPITGFAVAGKPAETAIPLIAAILELEFDKTHPLDASKQISKQVNLAAYVVNLRNDAVKPHVPVSNNTALNSMIAFLESALYYELFGTPYPGQFTYNPGSKFGTKLSVTDGL